MEILLECPGELNDPVRGFCVGRTFKADGELHRIVGFGSGTGDERFVMTTVAVTTDSDIVEECREWRYDSDTLGYGTFRLWNQRELLNEYGNPLLICDLVGGAARRASIGQDV